MDPSKLTEGQRAYEARRAAKAGMSLEAWLREKEKRAKAEATPPAKPAGAEKAVAAKKPGLLARLLERAQKPL